MPDAKDVARIDLARSNELPRSSGSITLARSLDLSSWATGSSSKQVISTHKDVFSLGAMEALKCLNSVILRKGNCGSVK